MLAGPVPEITVGGINGIALDKGGVGKEIGAALAVAACSAGKYQTSRHGLGGEAHSIESR